MLATRRRERISPAPGDLDYAHLRDLRDAVSDSLRDATGTWLDYGAGTAPYRSLLPAAALFAADFSEAESCQLDYELEESGRCPVPDQAFDGVLSTQVLEHVADPAAYLQEVYRVLRPHGRLVLSTHGVWEDHGGQDLWRWTADGLALLAHRAGFVDVTVRKLTCDARALLLLLRRCGRSSQWPRGGVVGALLRLTGWYDRRRPAAFDKYADRHVREGAEDPSFYLAVLLEARRPGER
jgi:SAM-dependent methyltransferase